VGVLYVFGITSLGVYGIVLAGWASNNKYSLLGGLRSSAQMISYELSMSLSVVGVLLLVGSLRMSEIVQAQTGFAWWLGIVPVPNWFLFSQPLGFAIFFTCALAETNRAPFDLPEAETELVAGFVTEYSGSRYLFFFLVEWGNLYVIGAIMTTLFLGGWQVPPVTDNPVALNVLQFITFFVKSYAWVLIAMWIRATLPRIRVDQLMSTCWKYLVPISFANFLGTALWVALWPDGNRVAEWAMTLIGFALVGYFFYRVFFHLRRSGSQLLLSPFS
jgi:NADH-quinone oxidoreductase subunit H